jgi:hypothetical protein
VIEDLATEPDRSHGQRVDLDLEREHDCAIGVRSDERRGPARRAGRRTWRLTNETDIRQLTDEIADRAPGQAGPGDEFGPRHRSMQVQFVNDAAEVRPPDGLTAVAEAMAGW